MSPDLCTPDRAYGMPAFPLAFWYLGLRHPRQRRARRLWGKKLLEEALGFASPRIGEDDRFSFARRVGNVALLMQTIERVPVVAFPGSPDRLAARAVVEAREVEKGEN